MGARSSAWIERLSPKEKVPRSNRGEPARILKKVKYQAMHFLMFYRTIHYFFA